MKRLRIILIPVLLLALAVPVFLVWRSRHSESGITLSGNIEVTDSAVAFQTAGRLVARLVDEGLDVRQGDVLARLDSTELSHQVALAEANLQAAQAQLKLLETGSRRGDRPGAGAAQPGHGAARGVAAR